MEKLRVIFMGTPEFGVPTLKALLADNGIEVIGVMSQPDRPSGRGQKLTPPPVKVVALEAGLEVRQPSRLRKEPEMIAWLAELKPDYLVTAAFGQILSQEVLDIPRLGTVNVHASLLPEGRGPNPVQWCILNGDAKTGVTTMFTELGVDTGPMLMKVETEIEPNEDTLALTVRLAQLGAGILVPTLHQYAAGTLQATPQDETLTTHAPKLEKEVAELDWTQPAQTIHNRIRGQQPSPGACSHIEGLALKFYQSVSPALPQGQAPINLHRGNPGEVLGVVKEGLWIQTGDAPLLVTTVQPPGKPRMAARDWANGFLQNVSKPCFERMAVSPEV